MLKKKEYKELVDKKTLPSKVLKNSTWAFFVGGSICMLGQFFRNTYESFGLNKELTGSAVSVTMIFLSVLLTGLNIYPKLAKHAGAGTIVPITGFANAVASPAIEAKTEGMVMGVGAKIFTIAGPVISYGITASVLAGIWYFFSSFL